MKLLHVVGARPNFPKLAPVLRAGDESGVAQFVVHTGQHYDDAMSDSFFRDLGIAPPHVNLGVGSDTHAAQTARIMERIEPVLLAERPDWVVVYGDVNSTMAAAIVASKLGIQVAHVEAGLRSFDRTMPEEINRIVTDRLANLLLTPSRDADAQLRAEGEPESEIAFVGNVMIDSLFYALPAARATGFRERIGVNGSAVVVTLHRPSNVDDPKRIAALIRELDAASKRQDSKSIACDCWSRWDTSRCWISSSTRSQSSPTQAACKRKQRRSAFPASLFDRTRSDRSRLVKGQTVLFQIPPTCWRSYARSADRLSHHARKVGMVMRESV